MIILKRCNTFLFRRSCFTSHTPSSRLGKVAKSGPSSPGWTTWSWIRANARTRNGSWPTTSSRVSTVTTCGLSNSSSSSSSIWWKFTNYLKDRLKPKSACLHHNMWNGISTLQMKRRVDEPWNDAKHCLVWPDIDEINSSYCTDKQALLSSTNLP